MRAAEHHRVDGRKVIAVKIPVQGAHHQVMVAKPSAFDDFHQIGARLGRNHVVRLETVHQCGELVLAQRQRRSRDDDVLRHVPCGRGPVSRGGVAPIAGDLQRGLHADDRNVVMVAQRVHRRGRGGVAGDDHRLDPLTHEPLHDVEAQPTHLLRGLRAVWRVRGIPEIQDPLVRHVLHDLSHHRNTAQAGIEYADRCRRSHVPSPFQRLAAKPSCREAVSSNAPILSHTVIRRMRLRPQRTMSSHGRKRSSRAATHRLYSNASDGQPIRGLGVLWQS